ncbi:MAG TPA: winged helix-turn-helix domain-containing protein [Candidatus Sulfotelmatobacter sp.]|nr:winged helix-turn-helix domain-containing protein [Candidatus Sulfotelmatobacter sp.]
MLVVACRKRLAVFASFELDLGTLELKKNGTRLRLEHKPACALACLLEHSGLVIERADLIRLLWPEESHGDFDHRLNKVINKIRFALGDNPSGPGLIQTLSRRGYRFTGEVRIVEQISSSGMSPSADSEIESLNPKNAEFPPDSPSSDSKPAEPIHGLDPVHSMHWWRWRSLFPQAVITALAVGLLFGAGAKLWSFVTLAKARRSIAVESFRHGTSDPGDAWLSTALADWLTTDLSVGDQLRAIPLDKVARAEVELGLANRDPFSRETLNAIRKNLGSDLVISGSYATVPGAADSLRLDVRLQDARNGNTLQSLSLVGTKLEALHLALDAGAKLRSVLGLEPLSSRDLSFVRTALPSNPDAARLYTEGVEALEKLDAVEASALLTQASSIEPEHVPTHAALASAWNALGYDGRAKVEAELALQQSKNLPREQQLLVQGLFQETSKEWVAAANVYGTLFRLYPDSIEYGLKLANAQMNAGNGIVALSTVQAMRSLPEPINEDPRIDLMEATAAASISDYRRQQQAAMRAEVKARRLGARLLVANAEVQTGSAMRSFGDLPQALQLWRQARETFRLAGDRRGIANTFNEEGILLWQRGDGSGAKAAFDEAIPLSRATGDKASLAFALSRVGMVDIYTRDLVEARQLFHDALAIYQEVENVQEQGYVLSLIADEQMWRDQLAEARKTYEDALALSLSVNDRSRVAGRLMDIGIIETVQGDLQGATGSLEKSLSIYRELGERNRVALVQNRLAIVMLWQGKISQAASTMESSLAIAREVGEANVVAEMYENQAYILMEENPEKAVRCALAAMDRHKANGDKHGVAMDSAILAQVFLLQGKTVESEAALNQAFLTLGPNPAGELGIQMFLARGQIHAAQGQIEAARTDLKQATIRARSLGADSMGMKARLALAELELKSRDKHARHDVDNVLRDASQRGFGLITAQAAKTLELLVQTRADSGQPAVLAVTTN